MWPTFLICKCSVSILQQISTNNCWKSYFSLSSNQLLRAKWLFCIFAYYTNDSRVPDSSWLAQNVSCVIQLQQEVSMSFLEYSCRPLNDRVIWLGGNTCGCWYRKIVDCWSPCQSMYRQLFSFCYVLLKSPAVS